MYHSTITAKGQTTIPKAIRDRLNLKPGDRIDFVVEPDGRVVLRPRNKRLEDIIGVLHRPGRRALTQEEIDEAIAAEAVARYERSFDRN